MANFVYRIDTHLLRPASIVSNISYQANSTASPLTFSTASETSVITSPFDGNAVNLNFFNLAMAVTDLTYQSTVFQGWSNNVESTTFGFVNYNGRQELESNFYGGSPLLLTGTTSFTVPYVLATNTAFQVAAANGIVYLPSGSIDTAQSTWGAHSTFRPIIFNDQPGNASATPAALASYLNSRLKFNTNDGTNTFAIAGNVNPTSGGWASLLATPKSFWIWWNDGFTAYTNGLTTTNGTTGLITLNSNSSIIVGAKITLNYTITNNLGSIQSAMQNALNSAIGNSNVFSIVQNGSYLTLNILNDRTQGGIYQLTLQDDAADQGTSPLTWLGWTSLAAGGSKSSNPYPITLSSYTSEAYDYTSIMQFVPTGVGPYYMTITGAGSYISLAFVDNYSSGTALLGSFGLPVSTATYYNNRRPLLTYQKTLNYGGPFWATTLNSTGNSTIGGNLTVNGSITSVSSNAYTLPSYVSNSNFEVNTINNVAPPLWVPYANTSASSAPTSGGAVTVYTYTVTYTSNPGGTIFVNGVSTSVSASLTTAALIAQFIGGLTQAGYTFAYTGTNTFTISVTGPYANPTVVNGTLTSGMVSFGFSNTFGIPNNAVVLAANNISPLYGAFDADISKPAANYQGQGFATPFAIDRGATGQPFQLMFYYNTTANYLSGDLAAFVYDVTNANLIPLSISAIPASPQASLFVATFYPSSSLNYRFLLHIASTNATAWTFEFDMLSISPQNPLLTIMPAMSAMTSFPMVLTASTSAPTRGSGVIEYSGYRRNGDQIETLWTYTQTAGGGAGTGTYYWSIPTGLTIDTTKHPVGSKVGDAWLNNTTSSFFSYGSVQVASATTLQINAINSTTNPETWALITNATSLINFSIASISMSFQTKMTIAQWSAQTNLATDFTEYASNTTQTDSADTTSFYNGKDGSPLPNALTAGRLKRVQFARSIQVTDKIELEVYDKTIGQWFPIITGMTASGLGSLNYVVQNAVAYGMTLYPVTGSSTQLDVAFAQYARPTGATYGAAGEAWTNYGSGANSFTRYRVRKIANGNTAEQLPVVRAEYTETSAATIETAGNRLYFNVKVEDTHNAVNTVSGSTWAFTAPVAGVYNIFFFGESASGNQGLSDTLVFDLWYNGAATKRMGKFFAYAAATGVPIDFNYTTSIRMNTGDYIYIILTTKTLSSITAWATSAGVGPLLPRIIIERIGN
jgi:hypothetical protein